MPGDVLATVTDALKISAPGSVAESAKRADYEFDQVDPKDPEYIRKGIDIFVKNRPANPHASELWEVQRGKYVRELIRQAKINGVFDANQVQQLGWDNGNAPQQQALISRNPFDTQRGEQLNQQNFAPNGVLGSGPPPSNIRLEQLPNPYLDGSLQPPPRVEQGPYGEPNPYLDGSLQPPPRVEQALGGVTASAPPLPLPNANSQPQRELQAPVLNDIQANLAANDPLFRAASYAQKARQQQISELPNGSFGAKAAELLGGANSDSLEAIMARVNQTESGGDVNAIGAAGETSDWQVLPSTEKAVTAQLKRPSNPLNDLWKEAQTKSEKHSLIAASLLNNSMKSSSRDLVQAGLGSIPQNEKDRIVETAAFIEYNAGQNDSERYMKKAIEEMKDRSDKTNYSDDVGTLAGPDPRSIPSGMENKPLLGDTKPNQSDLAQLQQVVGGQKDPQGQSQESKFNRDAIVEASWQIDPTGAMAAAMAKPEIKPVIVGNVGYLVDGAGNITGVLPGGEEFSFIPFKKEQGKGGYRVGKHSGSIEEVNGSGSGGGTARDYNSVKTFYSENILKPEISTPLNRVRKMLSVIDQLDGYLKDPKKLEGDKSVIQTAFPAVIAGWIIQSARGASGGIGGTSPQWLTKRVGESEGHFFERVKNDIFQTLSGNPQEGHVTALYNIVYSLVSNEAKSLDHIKNMTKYISDNAPNSDKNHFLVKQAGRDYATLEKALKLANNLRPQTTTNPTENNGWEEQPDGSKIKAIGMTIPKGNQ